MYKRLLREEFSVSRKLLASLLVAIGFALQAVSASATTICFDNQRGFSNPHIYMWNANPSSAVSTGRWPGRQMQMRNGMYCHDTVGDLVSVNVIFSDAGYPQTSNSVATWDNNCFSNGSWKSLAACGYSQPPVANAGSDVTVSVGQSVSFDGSASYDPDGTIVSYSWSNGLSGAVASRTYNSPGMYAVALTVTDDSGETDSDSRLVTVVSPVTVSASSICYDNAQNYANPTIYMWNGNPAGAIGQFSWPGDSMSKEGDFYCYDPGSALQSAGVIFNNNGSSQTQNLSFSGANRCYENGQWKTLESCGFATDSTNLPPVADAGSDIVINEGETAVFNAAGSSDPDGSIVTYEWSNGLTGVSPSRVYNDAGVYNVTLTVIDNGGEMDTDLVTVTVNEVVADIVTETSICFDNPDNYTFPAVYMWEAQPAGVQQDFMWPGQNMDVVGSYYCYDPGVHLSSVNVIFNDNGAPQSDDLVMTSPNHCYSNGQWQTLQNCGFQVSGVNYAPIANAGSDITIQEGDIAYFNGSASSDPDGFITSYAWSNGIDEATGSLGYLDAGTYEVTLTVTDNNGATDTDTVVVTVNEALNLDLPSGNAIYFVNNQGWNPPSAYVWDVFPVGTMAEMAWPGAQMTEAGGLDLWWVAIGEDTQSGSVIFNDNGNAQGDDLVFSAPNLCYNNGQWMTPAQCGVPEQVTADAGPDRRANQNSRLALSAAASSGNIEGATWESAAWSGTLTGASVVTPELTSRGNFVVTMTLVDGSSDTFNLNVVSATQGLPERPLLAAPLGFPISGSVASGNYAYEPAFPNLTGMFESPVMVTNDGVNDLIYVVDKPGTLSVFPNDPAVTQGEVVTVMDIQGEVRNYHEQGLLSIAFHPEFSSNRYAYIYYIEGANDNESDNGNFGDAILARIQLNSATNPTSVTERVEVLRIEQPGPFHKGGMMQFHPLTGEFYMSFGDGAYGDTAITPTQPDPRTNNSSQDTSNLHGSFIRISMRETPNAQGRYYDIPSDNPFVGNSNVLDEIWSYGHRNPWRWAFDTVAPYTLWETDVGQAGFEEVNIINGGGNYGWPICEGTNHRGSAGGDPNNTRSCTGDLVPPVGGTAHSTGSVSIIGGFVYRGNTLPGLYGQFIYGDYVSKKIYSIEEGGTDVVVSNGFPANISSFGTDVSGDSVLISSHGVEYGGVSDIYRMVDRDAQAATIPTALSETGVFADLAERIPSHGVIEYDVNSDGWFDGAIARHFVAIPNDQTINFDPTNTWDLPVGSVLVKHLELPQSSGDSIPFETSVLFRQRGGNWEAANYRWNAQGTDATLVDAPSDVSVQQTVNGTATTVTRRVLSGAECSSCHTGEGTKDPLAIDTRQLNGDFDYQGVVANQLETLADANIFSSGILSADSYGAYADPMDVSLDLDERARAYLDTNCAHCHGGTFMNMNFDTAIGDMDVMNVERSSGTYRMRPFDHSASLLYTYQVTDSNRMPKGTNATNTIAAQLFADWIDADGAVQTQMAVLSDSQTINQGATTTLTAVGVFNNGFELPPQYASWSTSNSSVISLNQTSGSEITVTAGTQGSATIQVISGGYEGTITLNVGGGPASPSNATATALSSSAISVSWQDNANDEDNYVVRRSLNANGPFSEVGRPAANAESFVDNGLNASTRYYYQIVAINDEGNSGAATANAQTSEPSQVDGVSFIAPNATVELIAGESKQLGAIATQGEEVVGITQSASWSSSNNSVVSVSNSGIVTAGSSEGTANITVSYEGESDIIPVTNLGAGQYVYFKRPSDWATPTAHIWTSQGGVATIRTGGWPGMAIDTVSTRYGGTWMQVMIPQNWANTSGNVNIIFSNNGNNQTDDLTVNLSAPSWFDAEWLAAEPAGDGVIAGTQIQIGNGEIQIAGSENLTGELFEPGTVVEVHANPAGPGMQFMGWEGTGAPYLLDPSSASTTIVVGEGLSFTLLAVFDTLRDDHKVGRDYYTSEGCSGCHGTEGNGYPSLANVASTYSLSALTSYIETNMPPSNSGSCTGECASSTAEMILAGAYTPPEGVCDATSLDDLVPQDRGYRLLSTLEYNNSIRDLLNLGTDVDVTTGRIPADIPINGYKTNANTVFTNDYAKGYILAAEAAAAYVTNIYDLEPGCGDLRCVISSFGKRAYRRPLTTVEINDLVALHSEQGDLGVLTVMLSSPHMLYRSEIGEDAGNGYFQLTDYEVATMLAYTYWATTPDDQLMAAADAGQLSTPEQVAAQVDQMLNDPRAEAAFDRFITGWLDLDKEIKTNTISDSLKADMKNETMEFVRRTVFNGGTYSDLITADYTYMTQQLANHYGISWPGGSGWQRVNYSGVNAERRGILGHAGILAIQSASEKTHPVKRGLFVRRSLLCQDFPPPPVGAVLKPQEDPTLTVRERFEEAHLQDGCESCHQYIDGIGFGFENYNSVGLYVTTETTDDGQVKPINAMGYIGSLNSAETFLSESEPVVDYHGMNELADLIAGSSNGKACYARQWYRYARGQREEDVDSCTIQVFGETFKSSDNVSILDLMVQFTQTQNYILRK